MMPQLLELFGKKMFALSQALLILLTAQKIQDGLTDRLD